MRGKQPTWSGELNNNILLETITSIISPKGHPVSSRQGDPLGEGFFPHFVGGDYHLKSLLFSPYPAIPPYVVKTPHPGMTDDREHTMGQNVDRRSQREPGGARGSQEEPGGSQEEPGGARGSQEEPRGGRRIHEDQKIQDEPGGVPMSPGKYQQSPRGVPGEPQESPRGVPEESRGSPRRVPGDPRGVPGESQGSPRSPRGVSGESQGCLRESPRGVSGEAQGSPRESPSAT